MAAIHSPRLAITTDRLQDRATIVVACDLDFTEFEVNAMNILGLRYTLRCDLLDLGALYDHTQVSFDNQAFPRVPGQAAAHEHAEFETQAAMHDLHTYVFGNDALEAQFTLTNEDTGAVITRRSQVVQVDLAA